MQTKYTPGPLEISKYAAPEGIYQAGIYALDGTVIATVRTCPADANLLAAAPDLLEVLEAIVEDCGYGGGGAKLCAQYLNRAKSAIAKATGE